MGQSQSSPGKDPNGNALKATTSVNANSTAATPNVLGQAPQAGGKKRSNKRNKKTHKTRKSRK